MSLSVILESRVVNKIDVSSNIPDPYVCHIKENILFDPFSFSLCLR